jgi:hypothetical protein
MDQKLKSYERMLVILTYHKYVCYVVGAFIVAMSINGGMKHKGTLKETIAFAVLGVGCCVFSMMSGLKQKAVLEMRIAQYKTKLAEESGASAVLQPEAGPKKPVLSKKARRR